MKKRVYRYFFDFIEGQEAWLNRMAAEGWRLVKCGQLSYDFERCAPGEYEYAVDFVAHKAYTTSKDYKAFLEEMGYCTHYKNINVGVYIGKVTWRPWGEGAGQFSTAPGSYQKELIIAEKKRDGKPFALHTDLSDSLTNYTKVRQASLMSAGMMLLAALAMLIFSFRMPSIVMILSGLLFGGLGYLFARPGVKASRRIRRLKEEGAIREYQPPSLKRLLFGVSMILILPLVFVSLYLAGVPFSSHSARNMRQTSWGNHWKASYTYLNGYTQRRATLTEGSYSFTVDITTEEGEISLTITGQDGREYYKETALQTATFVIPIDIMEKDRLTLRIDAAKHKGSYDIRWEPGGTVPPK